MILKVYGKLPFTLPRSPRYWGHGSIYRYSTSRPTLDSPIKPLKVINAHPDLNLEITRRAAKRLAEIYQGSKEVLRVGVESGGCHGFQYNLKLVKKDDLNPSANDSGVKDKEEDEFNDDDDFDKSKDVIFILPDNGGEVVVDEQSLKILNNTTLTYSTALIGSSFQITGGNMKSSCGCGSSFDVEV